MVERFKLLLGEAIEEQEAELYLDMAKLIILARRFPFGYNEDMDVEPQYRHLQLQIAVELYNKRGAEGELRHTEGGIDRTYESSGVSESLLKEIVPKAKVGF